MKKLNEDNAMTSVKQSVIEMVKKLPDDCTYEDIQYQIYVREHIESGLKDVEEGRFISQEEAKARFKEWLKSIGRPQPSKTSPSSAST